MKWISLKDRMPRKRLSVKGFPVEFILGHWDTAVESNVMTRAIVDMDGRIIDLESCEETNLYYWTHWMEIPDVPGGE